MKAVKLFILILAIIGLWASFNFILDFISSQKEGRQYVTNCSKVRIGMSVKEVREVMGDSTWNTMNESPQLYYDYNYGEPSYSLNYSAVFAASGWPVIQFDSATMKVNLIMCDIN